MHAVLIGILAALAFPLAEKPPPSLIISAAPTARPDAPQKRTLSHVHDPQRPLAPSSAAAKVITANAMSNIDVPQIDVLVDTAVLGLDIGEGVGFGAGLGFGGAGAGLGTSFFGNKANGEHVAFVVDVSASMSGEQFKLMKSELTRALDGLPRGSKYQVIFFSGPVWFAGQRIKHEGRTRAVVSGQGGKDLVWENAGGADGFVFADGKQPMPVEPWLSTNSNFIRKTRIEVKQIDRSYGITWHLPMDMVLSMHPKPDIVYFMTDGTVNNADEAVRNISKMNRRGGKKSKIFTTAMMEPKAADQLFEL
ncbi:MAG: hypothetical protein ACKVHP_16355, partial [Verrucomicrobiales bacterium]